MASTANPSTARATLITLPNDILVMLPLYLHNIEDFTSLSSTCTTLHDLLPNTTTPNQILRLAHAQTRIFFHPSPLFLLAAVSRELGNWARLVPNNEHSFREACQRGGAQGLLDLAISSSSSGAECGLTLTRLRQLHALRYKTLNPVSDIIDKCVGTQWCTTEDFWNGGVDDAYTIIAESRDTLFHLIIYGELFRPDLDALFLPSPLSSSSSTSTSLSRTTPTTTTLSVETRLEFIKYCLPDFACFLNGHFPKEGVDPRRLVRSDIGPYSNRDDYPRQNNQLALIWVLKSTRWRPLWKEFRAETGAEEFQEGYDEEWLEGEDERAAWNWRQRLWEDCLTCSGYEGLGMLVPAAIKDKSSEDDGLLFRSREEWLVKARDLRDKIAALEEVPKAVKVGGRITYEYPFLLGDLSVTTSGYCGGW